MSARLSLLESERLHRLAVQALGIMEGRTVSRALHESAVSLELEAFRLKCIAEREAKGAGR